MAEHHEVVGRAYELDTALPTGLDRAAELVMGSKKALDGLTFVLDGPNGVEVVVGVERAAIDAAFARMTGDG